MNEIQEFVNKNFGTIRTIVIDNEPWFVAKDICDILGVTNSTMSLKNFESDEVTKLNLGGLSGETNFVSESGFYTLVLLPNLYFSTVGFSHLNHSVHIYSCIFLRQCFDVKIIPYLMKVLYHPLNFHIISSFIVKLQILYKS